MERTAVRASLTIFLTCFGVAHAQTPIATFTATESFGVPHTAQVIEFAWATPQPTRYSTHSVVDDAGVQVPWQQTPDGKILVHTHLGRSTVHYQFRAAAYGKTHWAPAGVANVGIYEGMAITRASTCDGVSGGAPYYVMAHPSNNRASDGPAIDWYFPFRLSASVGGSPIYMTQPCEEDYEIYGAAFDGASNRIVWGSHGLQTGDPVVLTAYTGSFPAEVTAGTRYWVIRDDAHQFGVATSHANALAGTRIDFSASSARVDVAVSKVFTLQSGVATSPAALSGGVSYDPSNAAYYQVTNGITGFRVHKPGATASVTVSGSGATRTVAWNNHGLANGDAVGLSDCAGSSGMNNGYVVSSVSSNAFNITIPAIVGGSIPNPSSCTAQAHTDRFPMRAQRWKNGTWAENTAKLYTINTSTCGEVLGDECSIVGSGSMTYRLAAKSARYTVLESGPLRTSVAVEYSYRKPGYWNNVRNKFISGPGEGDYRLILTLDRGRYAIQVDQSTSMFLRWYADYRTGGYLSPTRVSFRAAGSNSAAAGRLVGVAKATFTADVANNRILPSVPKFTGQIVMVRSSGALPSPLQPNTQYTLGTPQADGSLSINGVTLSDAGSGTHEITWGNATGSVATADYAGEDIGGQSWNQYAYRNSSHTAFLEVGPLANDMLPTSSIDVGASGFCYGLGYRAESGCLGDSNFLYDAGGAGSTPVLGMLIGRMEKWDFANKSLAYYKNQAGNTGVPPFDSSSTEQIGISYTAPSDYNGAVSSGRWTHS
ncbi:MAG TPA: hypothetical protein DEH78_21990, partial [Solibacterales bacterium]|nr:hypothetical protein [Bryobacterales bacterium]